jgi:hypothetical protein
VAKEEEKGAPRWGWLPLLLPETVDDDGVAAGIGGQGNGGNDAVCVARRRRQPLSEGGPHAVLIFFNLTKIGSNLEFEKECITVLQKLSNFA